MRKICVISLDYDGCGDILFNNIFLEFKSETEKAAIKNIRQKLLAYLTEITKDADQVVLFVGSNRQDFSHNMLCANDFKNGSCFKNYEDLCKKNKWIFNKLLLADIQNGKPAGTSMTNARIHCYVGHSKIDIIKGQFENLKNNYPDDNVSFYFFDDDSKDFILPNLATYFKNPDNHIPDNVKNFKLIKYDWYIEMYQNQQSLVEHEHIKNNSIPFEISSSKKILSELLQIPKLENATIFDALEGKQETVVIDINKEFDVHELSTLTI